MVSDEVSVKVLEKLTQKLNVWSRINLGLAEINNKMTGDLNSGGFKKRKRERSRGTMRNMSLSESLWLNTRGIIVKISLFVRALSESKNLTGARSEDCVIEEVGLSVENIGGLIGRDEVEE